MPNWCENRLTITGPPEDMDRFAEDAKGTGPQYRQIDGSVEEPEEEILCFHKLFPVPDALLRRTYGGAAEDEKDLPPLDGCGNGCDWEIQHWGCKWGVDNRRYEMTTAPDDDTELGYRFLTAWSPPIGLLEHVSPRYPRLRFDLCYKEIGCGFKGRFIVQDGKVEVDASQELTEEDMP